MFAHAGKIITSLSKTLSISLGSIFFIPHPWISAIIWLALLQAPRYAAFAALGILIASIIGKVLKISHSHMLGGGLTSNALLISVMIAWLTESLKISWMAQIVITATLAAAASILSAVMIRVLKGSQLPALVWGYCIVATILYTTCPTCVSLATSTPLPPPPDNALGWLQSFISSLGSMIYVPNYMAGLFVGLAIILWSKSMFFTGMIAWLSGASFAYAIDQLQIVYYWTPVSYNFFIVGMALGSVFFLPGLASLLLAIVGGCLAAFIALLLQHALHWSPVAYLPITAAITIWLILITVSLAGNKASIRQNLTPNLRPEEAWWKMAFWTQRFGYKEVLFSIPLAGELRIAQGFNGTLSHTNDWRYALDFQRPTTIANSLDPALNIWGAPIYAPAPGIIERIKNTVADNQLGICNYAENWGNYVIILLDQGGWALLAHMQQGTITVTPGMRVEAGDYLGKVGNSGRSPIPHLHLQAQSSPELGAPTSPFRLVNYQSILGNNSQTHHWNAAAIPSEDDIVMAATPNQLIHTLLAGFAPGSAVWSIEVKGKIPRKFQQTQSGRTIRTNTAIDDAGQHLFTSNNEQGTLISTSMLDAWRITETRQLKSPLLKLLALATPSIPYSANVGMLWHDPVPLLASGILGEQFSLYFAAYLNKKFTYAHCKCISVPSEENGVLKIETTLEPNQAHLPLKLTCHFKLIHGPVKIQADFKNGSVIYTLFSFEPK